MFLDSPNLSLLITTLDKAEPPILIGKKEIVENYSPSKCSRLYCTINAANSEEISDITALARETIKGHLKSLFRKLDVKNRTEAAVLAVRKGVG